MFFCLSVGWFVCQLVGQSVCHNILKGREVPCLSSLWTFLKIRYVSHPCMRSGNMLPTRVAEPDPPEPAISVGAGVKIGEWSKSGQDFINGRSRSQNQKVKLELERAKTKKYTFQLKTCVEMNS